MRKGNNIDMANNRKKYNNKINISGKLIRKYRELQNLSREQLSTKLLLEGIDISAQSIANIENETRTVVDYELRGIASVLKIDVSCLLIKE